MDYGTGSSAAPAVARSRADRADKAAADDGAGRGYVLGAAADRSRSAVGRFAELLDWWKTAPGDSYAWGILNPKSVPG